MTISCTYTVLVTVTYCHDTQAETMTSKLLAAAIQQGLEEGTRSFNSVAAASVDAFNGEHIEARYIRADGEYDRLLKVRALHRDLVAGR